MTEDLCRCRHPASAHLDGEGECDHCAVAQQGRVWGRLAVCRRFTWSFEWENPQPEETV